jgi:hypothetical protein
MKLTSEQASEQMSYALMDAVFPVADTIEKIYKGVCDTPDELSSDVEMFIVFAYRLMHFGWDVDELQDLVENALGDVDIEREKVVIQ